LNFFQNIKLENYRNFNYFEIDFTSGCNILIGKNGSGKTNILESISLFEKGRGLRKDNINNLVNQNNDKKIFNVTSLFLHDKKEINLFLFNQINTINSQKKLLINNSSSSESTKYFENLFSLIYFLPEMERLFLNSPSVRRDFLDRLIYSTDKNYSRLINSYKKNIFERYKILKDYSYDYDWVNTLEKKIADLGINIYKKRLEHILILNTNLKNLHSYKKYCYRILLDINDEFINDKKKDLEKLPEKYLENLKKNREFDAVFLPGWEEGLFPHLKSLEEKGDLALEEERRLAYVGITRAKKESFISFVMNRMYRGDWVDSLASRFINELPEKNIKKEDLVESNNEDFFFNQDIDYNEGIRSPGWARLQKKKLKRIK